MKRKNRIVPIIMTVLIILIIIYMFVSIKQKLIVCEIKEVNDLGITISGELYATIDGNKIEKLELYKVIKLPDEYIDEIDSIMFDLGKSYAYLNNDVSINNNGNKIVVSIIIDDDETIILNNIKFGYNDNLQIYINSNTKSSDVVTLNIGDKYTEGELMKRLKNNGYSCK